MSGLARVARRYHICCRRRSSERRESTNRSCDTPENVFIFDLSYGDFQIKKCIKSFNTLLENLPNFKNIFIWKERMAAERPSDQNFLEIGKKLPQMSVLNHSLLN
jgi:hypothetical protein